MARQRLLVRTAWKTRSGVGKIPEAGQSQGGSGPGTTSGGVARGTFTGERPSRKRRNRLAGADGTTARERTNGAVYTSWTMPFFPHWHMGGAFVISFLAAVAGVVSCIVWRIRAPAFFKKETLTRSTPTLVPDPDA